MKMGLVIGTPKRDTGLHGLTLMAPDARIGVRSFCPHPCHRLECLLLVPNHESSHPLGSQLVGADDAGRRVPRCFFPIGVLVELALPHAFLVVAYRLGVYDGSLDGAGLLQMEQIAGPRRGACSPTIEEIRAISNEDDAGQTRFLYAMSLNPAQEGLLAVKSSDCEGRI
jgi:hypothetical protein